AQHAFGPGGELVIDRSASAPAADSRLVHYDPTSSAYLIASGDRLRWNAADGVTVFQETSPWDAQIRQDPPLNFHTIVESAANGSALRAPFLYPAGARRDAIVRDVVVLSPAGIASYAK